MMSGLGLVGLGFAGVTGGLAVRNASKVKAVCNQETELCDGKYADLLIETRSLGNASVVGLIVGGVGVAAGAATWFWAPPKEPVDTRERAGLKVNLGLGGVLVEGSF